MRTRFFRPAAAVFEAIFNPYMACRLRGPILHGHLPVLDDDLPLVLLLNHISWWDGFLARAIQRGLRPEGSFHTVMLERELRKHPYFRLMGCAGVEPGDPSSWRKSRQNLSLRRRQDPRFCLAFFPQGAIWPSDRRPLGFKPGILRLLRDLAPVQVVPAGIRIEPLNTHLPNAFASLGPAQRVDADHIPTLPSLEDAVQEQLDDLDAWLSAQGEAALHEGRAL